MKKFVLGNFLLISMVFSSSDANSIGYDFNLTKSKKATAYVDWNAQTIEVEIGENRMELPDISKDMMDYKASRPERIFFEDVNFDGYTDIGVIVGISYGEINVFADYYFYESKKVQFHKYLSNVSNLIRVGDTKILHAPMKSGSGYEHEFYQISEEGRPFLFLRASTSWSGKYKDDMKTVYYAKSVKVKRERAYFYDNWDGKKLKIYLVQGDKISKILGKESINGQTWIKVLYRGKNKIIREWVKMSDLIFDEIVSKKREDNEK